MTLHRLIAGALVSSFLLGVHELTPSAAPADSPCPPILLGSPKPPPSPTGVPAAPKDLRIISGGGESSLSEFDPESGSGPFAPPEPLIDTIVHSYFDALALRSECKASYAMRSQAELDGLDTVAESEKKIPVEYDPAMDAARFSIYAPVSADSQQKLLTLQIADGSMLLTWDFRFDRYFAWSEEGHIARHKTWRIDPGPWLSFKTDYRGAYNKAGKFAEMFMSIQAGRYLGPGTTRGEQEVLLPRLTTFYIEPDTWTRAWLYVEDIDKPVCYVSVWVADERRDPIQLYDRLAMLPPEGGPAKFRFEYDTSADQATNPREMHSWNRNAVVLHNISAANTRSLLKRP